VEGTYIDHRADEERVVMLKHGIIRALEANMQLSGSVILNILECMVSE
jgi:hypothetical protein